MANPYAAIFRAPGAKAFATAGFFARMPMAMAPIGIVAMLSQTHGEYWLAGAVSAAYALTNALVSPQISRLVDRYGQARVADASHRDRARRVRVAHAGGRDSTGPSGRCSYRPCSPP